LEGIIHYPLIPNESSDHVIPPKLPLVGPIPPSLGSTRDCRAYGSTGLPLPTGFTSVKRCPATDLSTAPSGFALPTDLPQASVAPVPHCVVVTAALSHPTKYTVSFRYNASPLSASGSTTISSVKIYCCHCLVKGIPPWLLPPSTFPWGSTWLSMLQASPTIYTTLVSSVVTSPGFPFFTRASCFFCQ